MGFRWYTRKQAQQLGLTGWVRNQPDGSVAVHIEGGEKRVDEMIVWLADGPPAAVVEDVATLEVDRLRGAGFEILA